jgi:hypothetical protein
VVGGVAAVREIDVRTPEVAEMAVEGGVGACAPRIEGVGPEGLVLEREVRERLVQQVGPPPTLTVKKSGPVPGVLPSTLRIV